MKNYFRFQEWQISFPVLMLKLYGTPSDNIKYSMFYDATVGASADFFPRLRQRAIGGCDWSEEDAHFSMAFDLPLIRFWFAPVLFFFFELLTLKTVITTCHISLIVKNSIWNYDKTFHFSLKIILNSFILCYRYEQLMTLQMMARSCCFHIMHEMQNLM